MAAEMQRQQDNCLSCFICTNLYRDPCTLDCGHTFCRRCLDDFMKTQQDAIRANSLLCPSCTQMSKVPDPSSQVGDWVMQFKPNFLIQRLMDDFTYRETADTATVDKSCFTCLQQGETIPAASYCTDCDIDLCKKCVKVFHSIPAHANHVLSDLGEKVTVRKQRKVFCKVHNNTAGFFCKDCHKAVCQQCCILDHRKCDNIVNIQSVMPDMTSFLKDNRNKLSQQLERIETSMKTMEMKITDIEGKKLQTLEEINNVSETVINLIRRKEKQLIKELEDITGKQVGDLRGLQKSGKIDLQMYQQHREFIDQALKAESEMDMYNMYQKCKSGHVTTVSDTDTQRKYTTYMDEITFVKETDQQAIDRYFQLGRFGFLEKKFDPKCTPILVDTINIKGKGDKMTPAPVDVTVLDVDGTKTLLVTDMDNKCLKSFYTRDQQACSSSLQLSSEPWCVTRLAHNQVAISYTNHNQIKLVEVGPHLAQLSNITTQKKYRGLAALNAATIVGGCREPPSLDILDLGGHVQRSIITYNRRLIQEPDFLSTTIKGHILVSDGGLKSVLCLTKEGDVIFNYKPSGVRELNVPQGITISPAGDILVADYLKNKVIQLKATGDFVRDLLTSQDGIVTPYGICLHKDKLYVVENRKPLKGFSVIRA